MIDFGTPRVLLSRRSVITIGIIIILAASLIPMLLNTEAQSSTDGYEVVELDVPDGDIIPYDINNNNVILGNFFPTDPALDPLAVFVHSETGTELLTVKGAVRYEPIAINDKNDVVFRAIISDGKRLSTVSYFWNAEVGLLQIGAKYIDVEVLGLTEAGVAYGIYQDGSKYVNINTFYFFIEDGKAGPEPRFAIAFVPTEAYNPETDTVERIALKVSNFEILKLYSHSDLSIKAGLWKLYDTSVIYHLYYDDSLDNYILLNSFIPHSKDPGLQILSININQHGIIVARLYDSAMGVTYHSWWSLSQGWNNLPDTVRVEPQSLNENNELIGRTGSSGSIHLNEWVIYNLDTQSFVNINDPDGEKLNPYAWKTYLSDNRHVIGFAGTSKSSVPFVYYDGMVEIIDIPGAEDGSTLRVEPRDVNTDGYAIFWLSIDREPHAYLFVPPQGNTPTGDNIEVEVEPGLTVTFDHVETGGDTNVTTSSTNPGPTSESFSFLGTYYDFQTTAVFTGDVEVCIAYDDSGLSAGRESRLKLRHLEDGTWVDITSSLDTENNIICGTTSSFSWFAIAFDLTIQERIEAIIDIVDDLDVNKGLKKALTVKLEGALDKVNNEHYKPAINKLGAFINHVNALQRGSVISDAEADDLVYRVSQIIFDLEDF